MLADLGHESSLDPALAGTKGARLAVARRVGLPVLPGFVVISPTSRHHMQLGAKALAERGSGGARLVVSGAPVDFSGELIAAGERLGAELVARSSTLLEESGEWAGAFTSYVDLTPDHLPKAVVGCWASAFAVDALDRQEKAGISPGSFDMAVLVQPALHPVWGGVAELRSDGITVIHAVEGPPAPLLQGWAPGKAATGRVGSWEGELVHHLDAGTIDALADLLLEAKTILGTNRCEWALDGDHIWLLQLDEVDEWEPAHTPDVGGTTDEWIPIVRSLLAAPGPLGAELVLPWAMGRGVPEASPRGDVGTDDLEAAMRLSRELSGLVWGMDPDHALAAAQEALEGLWGPQQEQSLRKIEGLREPDPHRARELMALIHGLRNRLAERGIVADPESAWHLTPGELQDALEGGRAARRRVGLGRWEPLVAAIVLTHGRREAGAAASPGLGAGLVHSVDAMTTSPPPRSVLYSESAAPVLSQLLWDASGVVTNLGSPASHLFESARSLGVPAVTGVELGGAQGQIVAVDGFAGVVATFAVGE